MLSISTNNKAESRVPSTSARWLFYGLLITACALAVVLYFAIGAVVDRQRESSAVPDWDRDISFGYTDPAVNAPFEVQRISSESGQVYATCVIKNVSSVESLALRGSMTKDGRFWLPASLERAKLGSEIWKPAGSSPVPGQLTTEEVKANEAMLVYVSLQPVARAVPGDEQVKIALAGGQFAIAQAKDILPPQQFGKFR